MHTHHTPFLPHKYTHTTRHSSRTNTHTHTHAHHLPQQRPFPSAAIPPFCCRRRHLDSAPLHAPFFLPLCTYVIPSAAFDSTVKPHLAVHFASLTGSPARTSHGIFKEKLPFQRRLGRHCVRRDHRPGEGCAAAICGGRRVAVISVVRLREDEGELVLQQGLKVEIRNGRSTKLKDWNWVVNGPTKIKQGAVGTDVWVADLMANGGRNWDERLVRGFFQFLFCVVMLYLLDFSSCGCLQCI
ncbi:late embryogenesis abundant protein [Striga asiatica]|uniref:Late embryogenesis abundant protein n=1 Tax=Striga asiatica TaxID=4170 RepID=A0A5A7PE96_STRAF|nr:late embryogenesis abundant protein [Striga asiatica]